MNIVIAVIIRSVPPLYYYHYYYYYHCGQLTDAIDRSIRFDSIEFIEWQFDETLRSCRFAQVRPPYLIIIIMIIIIIVD